MTLDARLKRLERLLPPETPAPPPDPYEEHQRSLWCAAIMARIEGRPLPPDVPSEMLADVEKYWPAFDVCFRAGMRGRERQEESRP